MRGAGEVTVRFDGTLYALRFRSPRLVETGKPAPRRWTGGYATLEAALDAAERWGKRVGARVVFVFAGPASVGCWTVGEKLAEYFYGD